ncbi:hypothetical protein BDN70DRAFT_775212, partial [Pholiota conissans]
LLSEEAFNAAQKVYDEQVKVLKFRKEVSRRLAYEHAKEKNPTKRITVGTDDPMTVLMAKLAGIPVKKPRVRPGYTVWGQNNRQFVDPIYEQRVKDGNIPLRQRAALRMQVYKECFSELDEDERREYENRATEEHQAAVEKIEQTLNMPPSEAPADRQQVLNNLPSFVQPILDLVAAHTGWKVTLLAGGPEPADKGRLNMMSFHAGETTGNIKINFGRSERLAYKNFVMPIFGNFLKKCYSVEDCRTFALTDASSSSLAKVFELDGGTYSVDSIPEDCTNIKIARPQGSNFDFNTPAPSCLSQSTALPAPSQVSSPTRFPSPPICDAPSMSLPSQNTASAPQPSLRVQHSPPAPSFVSTGELRRSSDLLHAASANPSSVSTTTASNAEADSERCRSVRRRPSAAEHLSPSPKRLRSSKENNVPQMRSRSSKARDGNGKGTRLLYAPLAVRDPSSTSSATNSRDVAPLAPLTREDLAGCPDWFLNAYQMLISKDFGLSWVELVRAWAHFERAESFEEVEKLGTTGRPPCISAWIARARARTYQPDLGTLSTFEKQFNSWWKSLQPEWRRNGIDGVLVKQPGNFEEIRRPGKNGIVSVIAALFFW